MNSEELAAMIEGVVADQHAATVESAAAFARIAACGAAIYRTLLDNDVPETVAREAMVAFVTEPLRKS